MYTNMDDLRTARQKLNLTQLEVVELTGVSEPTISMAENGLQSPQGITRDRLESLLGPIDWDRTLVRGIMNRRPKQKAEL